MKDGKTVERGCAIDENDAQHRCTSGGISDNKYKCTTHTCNKDGCNGASQYGPITLLIALPVAIAKIFSF